MTRKFNKKNKDLFHSFLSIIDAFNRYDVHYVIVGGVAVIAHGMPRLTQDLDILIEMKPENIEKLKEALKSCFDDESIGEINFQDLGDYSVIRYGTPDGFHLDIMASIGEKADYDSVQAETKEVEGIQITLATAQALYNLKKNTIRPEDKRDAFFLENLLKNLRDK